MNNLKGFYVKNKQLIMLTASIIIGIFLIFTVIALIINNRGKGENADNGRDKKTSANITTMMTETDTTDDESVAMQEETTTEQGTDSETETKSEPVKPQSLPYMIKVNRAANCITVYGKDTSGEFTVPVKAITCSTGKEVGDTPAGTFTTLVSYKWLLMVDGSYGQYAYRFYGPILFHSVPYFSKNKGDLEWEQYNKLGQPASLGCVRVTVADAIWLINNCPVGTEVIVYDDAANPGPLGKPETIKIPSDSPYRGWDPTDPDAKNPWHNFKPEIKVGKTSATVTKGSSADEIIKALGAKAYDTCGNDITSKLDVKGADTGKTGTYSVKLNVTDVIGKSADEVTVQITVKEKETTTAPTKPTETTTEEKETTTEQQSEQDSSTEEPSGETGTTETSSEQKTTENKTTEKETNSSAGETTQPEENTTLNGADEEGDTN